MYAGIIVRNFKSSSVRIFSRPFVKQKIQLNNVRQKQTSFSFKANVDKDVVLYELEKPSYFKFAVSFSMLQCAFWSHLGIFLQNRIRDSKSSEDTNVKSFWRTVLMDHKYASLVSVVAVVFGWTVLVGTCFYSFRSIRKLILNKGGKTVTIITYSLPGFNQIKKLPLSQVSSSVHRTHAKKFLPLKVKNKFFFYLLDTSGKFKNPELFDFTAGITRNF